jgi:multiple sugar transport system substrate-binding protein/sn-glycerol 3-phosphate transport system substrate-binding protein
MKRAILVLSLLALAASLFGQATSLSSVDPTGATVTFWYQHPQQRDVEMKKLIAEFNSTNPWKITVQGEYAGGYNDIYSKMVAGITAGRVPELVVAYQNQAATYQVNDVLTDLDPYVWNAKWGLTQAEYNDFIPGFIRQDISAQFGGQRLGFPPQRSIEVMYYNATWLKTLGAATPPATWDVFEALCKKATDPAKGTYGYTIDPFDASHLFAYVITWGGDIARADGKGYQFNTGQMRAVMTMMKRMYDAGTAKKIAKQYDYQNEFGNGKALFTTSSTSGIDFYDTVVKANKAGAFEWNVAALPMAQAGAKPALDLYGASVSVPRTSPEKQLAAWLFIKWFSEPKQQARWTAVSGGYFPVRKSAEPLIQDYLAAHPVFATAWKILNSSDLKSEPFYAGYDPVRNEMLAAFNAILDGAEITRTLADLETKANKIFKDSAP